jgi:predicted O-methyltransferase YrrM
MTFPITLPDGWMSENECRFLYDRASKVPSWGIILEIGAYLGRSTCCLAAGAKVSGGRVYSIDLWQNFNHIPGEQNLAAWQRNLNTRGLSARAIRGNSHTVPWKRQIAMLFIDGSHEYEDAKADFERFYPFVLPGGTIAFHDAKGHDWPGVERAWGEVKGQLKDTGMVDSIGFGRKA